MEKISKYCQSKIQTGLLFIGQADLRQAVDLSSLPVPVIRFPRPVLPASGVTRILPVVGSQGLDLVIFVRCGVYFFKTIGIYYLLIGQKTLMGGLSSSAFWNSLMGGLIPVTYRQSRAGRVESSKMIIDFFALMFPLYRVGQK